MAHKTVRLPSLSRVVPGSIATLELPIGPTYRRLFFSVSASAGLDATDIGRIDVLLDGKVVQTFKDLSRLMALNSYWNRCADSVAATAMQFALHFERGELVNQVFQRAPGIGTLDIGTFHIEITLSSGAPADIAITAHAEVDTVPMPVGAFFKVREWPFSSSVAGDVEIDKLPRGPWYSAIHLFKADVSAVEISANQVKVIEGPKAILERSQKEATPIRRVPNTASCTTIDLITDGDLTNSMRTDLLNDFRIKMTLDTAGSVDIVTETLDTLQGV